MKRSFIGQGVLLGAVIGGLLSLTHPSARKELKQITSKGKNATRYVIEHPTGVVKNVNDQLTNVLDVTSHSLDLTIDVLNQVEKWIQQYEDQNGDQ
ncbi:hypothetical protein SAMN05421734_10443 [Pelagirhabdus alkalitolerans]|uniref:Uncharacterized protein n=1 Tax=Pelagirhabdus alkalitolerans TaxID=1612202 RepID=A0A1G6II50_9BACI|nr:hypothetical protein [Pelagirhabdus alkalitolerans]SDC06207.1 hypothetical protein SAMN05421734_10443 [Pelagirhabdus alkalitolerans]